MGSKLSQSLAITLVLNLLFLSIVSSCDCGSGSTPSPSPKPKPKPKPQPKPTPKPAPSTGGSSPPSGKSCPINVVKLGVCANVVGGLLNLPIIGGSPPKKPCCPLVQGLINSEAAICLCTAFKANILGINLNVPLSLSLLVNYCGCKLPSGFQCPN